ncbi:FadR/GntR family transcriptional regulator [Govanella unica]|uniref:GntR family transcriptional regulator n=1 Tax=Govanella unica TaxID=2975056 RepID=A0A9X3TZ89_9PROT|nr:GntR family transcriptional regulator [Govania unica]MDA5194442.1 GntR family transcriptional regulator [Govania unica]
MRTTLAKAPRLLDRSRVADQIFEDLKSQIMSGALSRGARLPTEKELAEYYSVSGPTVREAIRGLSVIGLVDVRHGSGAYVSANGEALVAMSLGAVIQLETVGVGDALEILSVLNVHAATCAVKQATDGDLQRLRETTLALKEVQSAEQAAIGVRAFHHALLKAAHNPLLEVICIFLANIQVEFAKEVTGGAVEGWRNILVGLADVRERFVAAIERRDVKAAAKTAREFHETAMQLVSSMPKAQEVRLSDPKLKALLSTIVDGMARRS